MYMLLTFPQINENMHHHVNACICIYIYFDVKTRKFNEDSVIDIVIIELRSS